MAPGISRQTRRLFFYTLFFIFILIAPILIALSYGYRLDFGTGVVEKRGGIFVKSKTTRLSIFLNGNFVKETSLFSGGALLPEVPPGTYLLRIEKQGFRPWSKTVGVEPALVTELRQVLLLPRTITSATSTDADLALVASAQPTAENFSVDGKNNLIQKTATSTKIIAGNIYAFSVIEDTIFFIDKNGFLARLALPDGTVETVARPGFFLKEDAGVKFSRSPLGDLAILDESGGFFLLDPSGTVIHLGGGVGKISFDGQGEKILLAKEFEIEAVWLRPNPYQPFQSSGTKEKVLELGSRVIDAGWFYGDNFHIVIQTKDGVFFTELDGRGGRNTTELVTGKVDQITTVPELPNKIFYKIGKNWYTLEL